MATQVPTVTCASCGRELRRGQYVVDRFAEGLNASRPKRPLPQYYCRSLGKCATQLQQDADAKCARQRAENAKAKEVQRG